MTIMTRPVTLVAVFVAVLALALGLTGCGPRATREQSGSPVGVPSAPAGTTPDVASAQQDLDDVDALLSDTDEALAAADAAPADED